MMSNVSIFEKKWIDLVFEDKNQEYGAYQLRREHPRTVVTAFFLGIAFFSSVVVVFFLVTSKPSELISPVIHDIGDHVIRVSKWIAPPKETYRAKEKTIEGKEKNTTTEVTHKNLTHPVIVRYTETTSEVPTVTEWPQNTTTATIPSTGNINSSGSNGGGNGTTSGVGAANGESTDGNTTDVSRTYELDQSPEFPGGMEKFYRYVATHFKPDDVSGRETVSIMVSFIIEKDGSISTIRILREQGEKLDAEAIRVLKSLKTKWKPGIRHGKPVRTEYILPIKVKLS